MAQRLRGKHLNCAWIDNGTDDSFYTDTAEMGLQSLGATQDEGDVGVKTNSKLELSTVLRRLITFSEFTKKRSRQTGSKGTFSLRHDQTYMTVGIDGTT